MQCRQGFQQFPHRCLLKKLQKNIPEIWKQRKIIFIFAPQTKLKTADMPRKQLHIELTNGLSRSGGDTGCGAGYATE